MVSARRVGSSCVHLFALLAGFVFCCSGSTCEEPSALEDDTALLDLRFEDDSALELLQRAATKKEVSSHGARQQSQSADIPLGVTSIYSRPAKFDALPESNFVPNSECGGGNCSQQVHITLGGPGEMVVSFASSPDAETPAEVKFALAADWGLAREAAEGTTETYSQLMFWNPQLVNPAVKGRFDLSAEAEAKIRSTDTWAFDKETGKHYKAWKHMTAKQVVHEFDRGTVQGKYKNPSEYYDSPALHTVVLKGLKPGQEYKYQVANDDRVFSFRMPEDGRKAFPFKVGVISDVGQTPVSNSTFFGLAKMSPDVVVLSGDLSYADGYYHRWDTYGQLAEQLGAFVPVMSCPGNHEVGDGEAFVSYRIRYPMPFAASGSSDSSYWSRDMGPMHVISINSYAGTAPGTSQFRWLSQDLQKYSRERTPWLVVLMHVPFYNSNSGHLGEAKLQQENIEDMLYQYGVP
ncbi:unnamed protein product [Polarella glacialis]|uniref:Purple acid phosphatase n=1 Tax=Polarella glacialis TaxID=89957 RepID=A0A813GVS2_POLGL|nr:unnamed protein product [Polarella glacialis]